MERGTKEYWPILVIFLTYLLAIYCCIIELLLDFFCDSSYQEKFARWKAKIDGKRDGETRKRYALITGADGTVGIQIVDSLASLGYEIIVVGLKKVPNPSIKTNSQIHFIHCDLLHHESLDKAISTLKAMNFSQIDLAVFSAGVMLHAPLDTKHPIDPHHGINLLAHAKILEETRELLEKSDQPRVVFVSSATSRLGDASDIVVDNSHAFRDYINGYKSYADSKLAVNLYCRALAKELQETKSNIKIVSVHPGVVPGGLYRNVLHPVKVFINKLLPFILRTPERAAAEVLEVAFDGRFKSGDYVEHNRSAGFMNYTDVQLDCLLKNVRREIS